MDIRNNKLFCGYWTLTLVLFVVGLVILVVYTPTETSMGPVQKIFYIHLPVAISMFLAAFTLFIASVAYLWQRSMKWDDLAEASGKITVLFCSVVLLTGMIWGKSAWGQWWTWSPRLTFSLVLWLLYIVYLMIRPMIESPTRRATVSAVYGLAAFLDVPLVYISVKLMPDIHPSSIELEPAMKLTLLVWSFPVPMLMGGLIMMRYKLNRRVRALAAHDKEDGSVSFGIGVSS
jgi:heme exporter protein C